MRVLVVNAGSSSLKLTLVDERDEAIVSRELEASAGRAAEDELAQALRAFGDVDGVGHRIVHGGPSFREATVIDPQVRAALEQLVELAPLHQPKSLAALDVVSAALPQLPAVACFDTAFHATLPPAAATYPLPAGLRERFGLRRYGFHGLSHAWIARRAPQLLGERPDTLRIVSCHLGAGASACAIAGGLSVDTTMGFTPLEGLAMATRSGSVDPGLLLWLLQRGELTAAELADTLEHRSGLLGLGGTADMREILARAALEDPSATLALEVYLHRLRGAIAAMAASLGGIDALAFTGGVGERAAEIRQRAADGLGFIGVEVDAARNSNATSDSEIGAPNAPVRVLVLAAREDLEIARQTRIALSS